ncbi:MAG: HD-GYP domain-containing protein [Treponema sp.]|jgi:HD-GYP domain-containing protein (c-di-GMP phosphodiesterase class II)|nr:HD-GYP domain-containing protein [Treponema sp.]
MNSYDVVQIQEGSLFSGPLYLDEHFILATPEIPFSKELAAALLDWRFQEVYSEGTPRLEKVLISDKDKLKRALEFYEAFQKYVTTLFTPGMLKNDLSFTALAQKIQEACAIIQLDSHTFFRVSLVYKPEVDLNYQVAHAITSTILSLSIGVSLKLPNEQLEELGVAALLHEIGMTKLPSKVNLHKRELNLEDRKAIITHPILSYNLLSSLTFPPAVCNAVLQHHERENGNGYPQKLTGNQIGLYAKIIGVSCSYEAMISNRPHKKAKDMHSALLYFLKNEGKQYDDTVVRALVNVLSPYPIGLYVLLSNGQKGQVVEVNPKNFRFPIVQLTGIPRAGKVYVQTSQEQGMAIVRTMTKEEFDTAGS